MKEPSDESSNTYSRASRSGAASLTGKTTSTLGQRGAILAWHFLSLIFICAVFTSRGWWTRWDKNLPWHREDRSHQRHHPLPVDRRKKERFVQRFYLKQQSMMRLLLWWETCCLTLGPDGPASPLAPSKPLKPCRHNQPTAWCQEKHSS